MKFHRASPVLIVLTLLVTSLLVALGLWQLDRAEQKRALIAVFNAQIAEPAIPLIDVAGDWRNNLYRKITAKGEFLTHQQVLLENQVRKGRAGVHDYRIFRTENGTLLLVNLGWHETSGPYAEIDSGQMTLTGLMRPPPEVGLRLGTLDSMPFTEPLKTPYLDINWISSRLGIDAEPYVVLIENATIDTKEWLPIHFPPEKHLGYALTWFSLAITLLILFCFYSLYTPTSAKRPS